MPRTAPGNGSEKTSSEAVSGPAATTLGQITADLGPELVEIALAPRGLDVPITGVWLHDPDDALPADQAGGALLLLVGSTAEEDSIKGLLAAAGDAGAHAIACRNAGDWPRRLLEAADEAGLALLSVSQHVGWGELYELARAASLVDADKHEQRISAERSRSNDLSAIAEALAAIAGGSVTIDDMQSRVLAFSGGEQIDQMRMASILNRRLPEQWLREMRQRGVIERLLASDDVIRVNFGDSQPRRAIAIRVGKSMLGSIWLAGDEDALSPDADDALRRGAQIAALEMMRQQVADDAERRMQESALATLLRGGEAAPRLLVHFGERETGERFVVLAVEVTSRSASSPASVGRRLGDLLKLHLQSYGRPAITTALDDDRGLAPLEGRVYVLTSARGAEDRAALVRTTAACLRHVEKTLGITLRTGIGNGVQAVGDLVLSRRGADDCLALGNGAERVVLFEEVEDRALLREVEAFLIDRRLEPAPAFRVLVESDEANGTEYLHTLRCLFDAFGSAAQVAERLHLHPNTVRYRMRRIAEITGVDFSDGDARLALELTLRAHDGSDGRGTGQDS